MDILDNKITILEINSKLRSISSKIAEIEPNLISKSINKKDVYLAYLTLYRASCYFEELTKLSLCDEGRGEEILADIKKIEEISKKTRDQFAEFYDRYSYEKEGWVSIVDNKEAKELLKNLSHFSAYLEAFEAELLCFLSRLINPAQ